MSSSDAWTGVGRVWTWTVTVSYGSRRTKTGMERERGAGHLSSVEFEGAMLGSVTFTAAFVRYRQRPLVAQIRRGNPVERKSSV